MNNIIKFGILISGICLLITTSTVFAKSIPATIDYSGHWELNTKKTVSGGKVLLTNIPVTLFIEQDSKSASIQKLVNGKPVVTDTLSLQTMKEAWRLSADSKTLYYTRFAGKGNAKRITRLVYDLVPPFVTDKKEQAPKVDFSGEWNINKDKSDFFGLNPDFSTYAKLVIEQNDKFVQLSLQFKAESESDFVKKNNLLLKDSLNFNGKKTVRRIANSYLKHTHIIWSADGNSFITETRIDAEAAHHLADLLVPYDVKEIYVLSDNKQEITLHRISITPEITYTVRAVFTKAK